MKNRAGMCSLTISDVTSSDSGEYSCKARNEEGETEIRTSVKVEGMINEELGLNNKRTRNYDKIFNIF